MSSAIPTPILLVAVHVESLAARIDNHPQQPHAELSLRRFFAHEIRFKLLDQRKA